MIFTIENIQEMWKKDSVIDIDNLHSESLNIPILHSKYFEIYNTTILLKKKAEQTKKTLSKNKYEYFSGKADPEVYEDNPLPLKIRDKTTIQKYIDSDREMSDLTLKIEYYESTLNYLESILKQISERNWQIKNSIEFMKFQAGLC